MSYKQIAKSIKAAGLQKLRFYCEMCSKQCRDENGFQNHLRSESHARQMTLFLENSSSILQEKSNLFEKAYIDVLRRHGTIRHNANQLYQEIVADRDHVRLNATRWTNFSDFVQYLGQTGKAEIDFVEGQGWFIQYTFKDAAAIEREKKAEAHRKMIDQSEALGKAAMEKQLLAERQAELMSPDFDVRVKALAPTTIDPTKRSQKLTFALTTASSQATGVLGSLPASSLSSSLLSQHTDFDSDEDENNTSVTSKQNDVQEQELGAVPNFTSTAPLKRALQTELLAPSSKRQTLYPTSTGTLPLASSLPTASSHTGTAPAKAVPWIRPELIVKIMNKSFKEGSFYKMKGEITKIYSLEKHSIDAVKPTLVQVTDSNEELLIASTKVGEVQIDIKANDGSKSSEKARFPITDFETVIPSLDREVAIVQGEYAFPTLKLSLGTLVSVDFDKAVATVKLTDKRYGVNRGKEVKLSFDDICKTVYS